MKIAVLGAGRSGKDSLCEHVRDTYGLNYKGSSEIACEKVVFPKLSHIYKTEKDCFNDRHNESNRELWFNLIQEYNTPDKSRLAKDVLAQSDIYCGMRCKHELEASRHLFDLVIWVDATERLGVTEDSSSITVSKDMADIIIENNADLDTFKGKIERLFDTWFNNSTENRQEEFRRKVWAYYFKNKDKYAKEVITAFIEYWGRVEGKKLKYENEKSFVMGRRLRTFATKQGVIDTQNRIGKYKKYLGKINPDK